MWNNMGAMHRPLTNDNPGVRPPGAILQSRGSLGVGAKVILAPSEIPVPGDPFVKDSVSPMSAVYPLHLRREIDRRWFQRSEQTASVRARLKVMIDGLREAAVTHEQDERPRH